MKGLPAKMVVPVALLVLAGGGWIYLQVRAAQEKREQVDDLLADVDRELAKERPDGSELSLLVTRIRKAGDPERDDRLRRAMARIEVARGRTEKAWDWLEPLAVGMGRESNPDDQLLGARLLARLHAITGRSQDLRQALQLAEEAHLATEGDSALFLAWQCAQRLGAEVWETRESLGDRLIEQQPESPRAALIALLRRPQDEVSLGEYEALARRFDEPPVELAMALAAARLRAGEIAAAMRELDGVVREAPALVDLRHLAATACWAFLTGAQGAANAEIQRRRAQMREHLRWLLENASPADPRRSTWERMLDG